MEFMEHGPPLRGIGPALTVERHRMVPEECIHHIEDTRDIFVRKVEQGFTGVAAYVRSIVREYKLLGLVSRREKRRARGRRASGVRRHVRRQKAAAKMAGRG